MMILSVFFNDQTYGAICSEDSTVLDIKHQLAGQVGIPVEQQELTCQGTLLLNESKVFDYQITSPNSLLFLHELPLYEIKLSYPDGKMLPMKIYYNTTIDDLKMIARATEPSLTDYLGLDVMHWIVSLEDRRFVRSYPEIHDGADLKLVPMFEIRVIWDNHNIQHLVVFHGEKTVKELKQKLRQVHGIRAPVISLFLPHDSVTELRDNIPLKHYGITHRGCKLVARSVGFLS